MAAFIEKTFRWFLFPFEMVMIHVFRLKKYGESLWNESVYADCLKITLVITAGFILETWAWNASWRYALRGAFFVPLVMAVIFATAIAVYETSIWVMDKLPIEPDTGIPLKWFGNKVLRIRLLDRAHRHFIIRGLVMLAIAWINTIPIELRVFQDEIDTRIAATEEAGIAAIRHRAEAAELDHLDPRGAQQQGAAQEDIQGYQQRRATDRTDLVSRQNARRIQYDAEVARAQRDATAEAAGNGPSGRYGASNVYASLRDAQHRKEAERAVYETQAQTELVQFDRETNTHVASLRGDRQRVGNENEAARQAALARIRAMSGDQLVQNYGGHWREAHGFLARRHVLQQIKREDPDAAMTGHIWQLALMVLGTLVLSLSASASLETNLYYSLQAQAAHGHEQAMRMLLKMGYVDMGMYGRHQSVRDRLANFHEACEAYHLAFMRFEETLRKAAREQEPGGRRHQAFHVIVSKLLAAWSDHVTPTIHQVAARADQIQRQGIVVPAWPAEFGADPRSDSFRPWDISPDMLALYGWIDPKAELDEIRDQTKRYAELRRELVNASVSLDSDTAHWFKAGKSLDEVDRARREVWNKTFGPLLDEMLVAETRLQELTGNLPRWPDHTPDPRRGLQARVCHPSQNELERLGAPRISATSETPDSDALGNIADLDQFRKIHSSD